MLEVRTQNCGMRRLGKLCNRLISSWWLTEPKKLNPQSFQAKAPLQATRTNPWELLSLLQMSSSEGCKWGDRLELNPQPQDPQSCALTKLSYGHHELNTK